MTESLRPIVYTVNAIDSSPITREPSLSFADLLCRQFSLLFCSAAQPTGYNRTQYV